MMDVTGTDPRTRTSLFLWPWAGYPAVTANAAAGGHAPPLNMGATGQTAGGNPMGPGMLGMPNNGSMPMMMDDPFESFYHRFAYPGSNILPPHQPINMGESRHGSRDRIAADSSISGLDPRGESSNGGGGSGGDSISPSVPVSRNHTPRLLSPNRLGGSHVHRPNSCMGDTGSLTNAPSGSHAAAIAAFASAAAANHNADLNSIDSGLIHGVHMTGRHSSSSHASDMMVDKICNGLTRSNSQFSGSSLFGTNHAPVTTPSPISMTNSSPVQKTPSDMISAYNHIRSQQLKDFATVVADHESQFMHDRLNGVEKIDERDGGGGGSGGGGIRQSPLTGNHTPRTQTVSQPSCELYSNSNHQHHHHQSSQQQQQQQQQQQHQHQPTTSSSTSSHYLFNSKSPMSDSCDVIRDPLNGGMTSADALMRHGRFLPPGLRDKSAAAAMLFRNPNTPITNTSPDPSLNYQRTSELFMNVVAGVAAGNKAMNPCGLGSDPGLLGHHMANGVGSSLGRPDTDVLDNDGNSINTSQVTSSLNNIPPGMSSHGYTHATKGYKCKICQHVCFSRHDLSTHNAATHKQDPRPYRCEQCGRQFTTCAYLSQHRRIHTGVKPYACRYCDRRFTQLSHVQQHERIHTGEKPYRCTICMKSFTQMSNLQSHQRQHMKGKPHRCEQCFMSFDSKEELDLHVQAKHSGNRYAKVLVCPVCSKSYNSETYLAKHMDRHKEAANPTGAASASSSTSSVVNGAAILGGGADTNHNHNAALAGMPSCMDELFASTGFHSHSVAMAAAALSRGGHGVASTLDSHLHGRSSHLLPPHVPASHLQSSSQTSTHSLHVDSTHSLSGVHPHHSLHPHVPQPSPLSQHPHPPLHSSHHHQHPLHQHQMDSPHHQQMSTAAAAAAAMNAARCAAAVAARPFYHTTPPRSTGEGHHATTTATQSPPPHSGITPAAPVPPAPPLPSTTMANNGPVNYSSNSNSSSSSGSHNNSLTAEGGDSLFHHLPSKLQNPSHTATAAAAAAHLMAVATSQQQQQHQQQHQLHPRQLQHQHQAQQRFSADFRSNPNSFGLADRYSGSSSIESTGHMKHEMPHHLVSSQSSAMRHLSAGTSPVSHASYSGESPHSQANGTDQQLLNLTRHQSSVSGGEHLGHTVSSTSSSLTLGNVDPYRQGGGICGGRGTGTVDGSLRQTDCSRSHGHGLNDDVHMRGNLLIPPPAHQHCSRRPDDVSFSTPVDTGLQGSLSQASRMNLYPPDTRQLPRSITSSMESKHSPPIAPTCSGRMETVAYRVPSGSLSPTDSPRHIEPMAQSHTSRLRECEPNTPQHHHNHRSSNGRSRDRTKIPGTTTMTPEASQQDFLFNSQKLSHPCELRVDVSMDSNDSDGASIGSRESVESTHSGKRISSTRRHHHHHHHHHHKRSGGPPNTPLSTPLIANSTAPNETSISQPELAKLMTANKGVYSTEEPPMDPNDPRIMRPISGSQSVSEQTTTTNNNSSAFTSTTNQLMMESPTSKQEDNFPRPNAYDCEQQKISSNTSPLPGLPLSDGPTNTDQAANYLMERVTSLPNVQQNFPTKDDIDPIKSSWANRELLPAKQTTSARMGTASTSPGQDARVTSQNAIAQASFLAHNHAQTVLKPDNGQKSGSANLPFYLESSWNQYRGDEAGEKITTTAAAVTITSTRTAPTKQHSDQVDMDYAYTSNSGKRRKRSHGTSNLETDYQMGQSARVEQQQQSYPSVNTDYYATQHHNHTTDNTNSSHNNGSNKNHQPPSDQHFPDRPTDCHTHPITSMSCVGGGEKCTRDTSHSPNDKSENSHSTLTTGRVEQFEGKRMDNAEASVPNEEDTNDRGNHSERGEKHQHTHLQQQQRQSSSNGVY